MTARKGKAPVLYVILASSSEWRVEYVADVFELRQSAVAQLRDEKDRCALGDRKFRLVKYEAVGRKGGRRK
jgi:hypothetical protein